MAVRKMTTAELIEDALMKQLESMGANLPHFADLVKDYMKLWAMKEALAEDIRKRGVSYEDRSSTGVLMIKNNPSVKDLPATNRQMLALLRELGVTVDKVAGPDVDI